MPKLIYNNIQYLTIFQNLTRPDVDMMIQTLTKTWISERIFEAGLHDIGAIKISLLLACLV